MPITCHVTRLSEAFNVRSLFQQWDSQHKSHTTSSDLVVRELTYGLATTLEFTCKRCSVLGVSDRRGWKNHCAQAQPIKSTTIEKSKSNLCQFDINIRYCLALQFMGVGSEHAAILASFLDLPEPYKWPRQFSVLQKNTHMLQQKK
jgi:hypothetical protein